MKKIITSILILSTHFLTFGQGVVIKDLAHNNVTETVYHVSLLPNSYADNEFLVLNTNSSSGSYKVRRTILVMDTQDSTQFCWGGTCYGYPANVSTYNENIASGDSVNFAQGGMHIHFVSGPSTVIRKVHYKIYNTNTTTFPADTTGFTIQYDPTGAGVNELKADGEISNVFPNPASGNAIIKYDVSANGKKAKIVFYDMLGKEVKEINLNDKQGIAKVATDDLFAGVYFYSLLIDDKIISTKKFVVTR
ncbi:MAG: T9SS type A sorting domain-containing protein [Bacteroidota bacterium]